MTFARLACLVGRALGVACAISDDLDRQPAADAGVTGGTRGATGGATGSGGLEGSTGGGGA